MCGIVGYVGNKDAVDTVVKGLRRLEYRGYDSAGIAIIDNLKRLQYWKAIGPVSNLEELISSKPLGETTVCIGHTRWATHGEVSEENCHPIFSSTKRFAVVHNGVIANYEKLKTYLIKNGITFVTDTDTEVIPQLLEKFSRDGLSTEDCISETLKLLEGSYALGIIDCNVPDKLFAAKNQSPLVLAKGEDFNGIASDFPALISKAREFINLNDGEYAVITCSCISIYQINGTLVNRDPFTPEIEIQDVEKGPFPNFMMKEVHEQPLNIRKIILHYCHNGISSDIVNALKECDTVYFIGCGTSYNAGMVGVKLFETLSNKPARVLIASEVAHNPPIFSQKAFFILLSQSGETADVNAALKVIKGLGYKALVITNNKESTLWRETDYHLPLLSGPEISVASTKTYTAQIAILSILASLINDNNIDIFAELSIVANLMEAVLNKKDSIDKLVEKNIVPYRTAFYIGRGMDYAVCLEAALKLKEISYIFTEAFPSGELKHGPISLIEKGTPVIAIITDRTLELSTRSNIKEVAARGAKVISIVTADCETIDDDIVIPKVFKLLTPMIVAPVIQLIAYYAALQKGCNIDKPRNLAKSVTVE